MSTNQPKPYSVVAPAGKRGGVVASASVAESTSAAVVSVELRGARLGNELLVVPDSRRVIQKVTDGDGARGARQFRQQLRHWLVIAQFAVSDQQHDGHCGELLRERSESEVGRRRGRCVVLEIGQAVGAAEQHCAVPNDDHTRARNGAAIGAEQRIDGARVDLRHARRSGGCATRAERERQYFADAYQAFQVSCAAPMVSWLWLRTSGMRNSNGSRLSFSSHRSSLSVAARRPSSPKRRESRSMSAATPYFCAKRRSSPTAAARSFKSTKCTLMRRSAKKRSAARVSALFFTPKT